MHTMRRWAVGLCVALVVGGWGAAGCGGTDGAARPKPETRGSAESAGSPAGPAADDPKAGAEDDAPLAAAWAWTLPKGIHVPPRVPDDNPMSAAKVALGHRLFMDKRLSVDGTRSCYSCHQNELGNADGRTKALGPGQKDLPRNTPTIWNVGLSAALYWDGRADTLEAQGLGALKGGNMALGDGVEAKAAEVGATPEYAAAFAEVFALAPGTTVTGMHVAQALSAYQRTLLCGDTVHDNDAQDDAAKRGWALFTGVGGCIICHGGDNFSDGLFHRTGVGAGDPNATGVDLGRGKVTGKPEDAFAFRTPSLRNVSHTAPYFHDGSVATLEDAVRIMASGGITTVAGPVDANLVDRRLSEAQIGDLVAFLKSLECPGTLEVIGDQTVEGIGAG